MKTLENNVQTLFSTILSSPDGFTASLDGSEVPTSGYVVALAETQGSFGVTGFLHAANVAKEKQCYLGGWLDAESGLYYFDAVRIFPDLGEALDAGRAQDQIAIWNIEESKEIRLK